MSASGLELRGVRVDRGGLAICRDVSLSAPPGEVTVLLGANGAGKTTLLEAISGVLPVAAGDVTLDGREIGGLRRDRRARAGIAHVEQGRAVFRDLTVAENLALPAGWGPVDDLLGRFPALARRRDTSAAHLSGGEQQMLVIARALAAGPRVLLLDELSLGLAPMIVHELMGHVRALAGDEGLAVLLVEQYTALALRIGRRAFVLRHGELTFTGACEDLLADPELMHAAYMGAG